MNPDRELWKEQIVALLHKRHGTPEISMTELASMCDTCPPTAATT